MRHYLLLVLCLTLCQSERRAIVHALCVSQPRLPTGVLRDRVGRQRVASYQGVPLNINRKCVMALRYVPCMQDDAITRCRTGSRHSPLLVL